MVCVEPRLGQEEPPVEQRVAVAAGIAQKYARLAGVGLAGGAAPLRSHARRVVAALGHVAAIQNQHPVRLAQRRRDQALVLGEDRVVVPGALADELLQRPHLAHGVRPRTQQPQGHRLDVLAPHVGQQQPAQIHLGPRPLLASGKQGSEVGMVGGQFLPHVRQVLRAQGHDGRYARGQIRDGHAVSAIHQCPPATLQPPP